MAVGIPCFEYPPPHLQKRSVEQLLRQRATADNGAVGRGPSWTLGGQMRVAHGSQPFRRDTERSDIHEAEPFLARSGDDNNHDHPAEEVSLQRLQVLARRIAFPFARRIPRVTKRYSSPYSSKHALAIFSRERLHTSCCISQRLRHSDGVFGRSALHSE